MPALNIPRMLPAMLCLATPLVTPTSARAGKPAPLPPLQLAESVPVETTLDDPQIPDAAPLWVELIDSAKTQIDISQFYVSPRADDPKARPGPDRLATVLDAIERAARRGVKVRIVADAKFQKTYPATLTRLDALNGVEVRRLDLDAITGGVQHAKYFIVDNERAWVGSQNFDWRSLDHIHELGLAISAPDLVAPMGAIFALDWDLAGGAAPPPPIPEAKDCSSPQPPAPWSPVVYGGGEVQALVAASPARLLPPGVPEELPLLLTWIDGAKTSLHIQLLSYAVVGYDKTYWDELDAALRRAAARGVEVRLVVADWSRRKGKIEALRSLDVLKNIDVRFAVIPQAAEGPIEFARVAHAKYAVIDGQRTWLGTSNWSRDYFEASRNLGVFVDGAPFAADVERVFGRIWEGPYSEPLFSAKRDEGADPNAAEAKGGEVKGH